MIHVTQFEEKPKSVSEHPSGTLLGGMPVKKLFEGRVFSAQLDAKASKSVGKKRFCFPDTLFRFYSDVKSEQAFFR